MAALSLGEKTTLKRSSLLLSRPQTVTRSSACDARVGWGDTCFVKITALADVSLCSPGGRVTTETQGQPAAQLQCCADGHTLTSEPPWGPRAVHGHCPSTSLCKRSDYQKSAIELGCQENSKLGFPGRESACQRRRHGLSPWSGKIPHASEQLSL